jgi:hypothetical protein
MALNFLPGMQSSSLYGTGDFKPGNPPSPTESPNGKPVKSDPLTAIATSLFGGKGGGGGQDMAGLDWLGDFNPDSFVSSTLAKSRQGGGGGGGGGGGFAQVIGSIIKALK